MTTNQQARLAGILFILTFITSIPAALLYGSDPLHTSDARIFAGAGLELALIVANIGSALAFFPLLRKTSESLSLAYIAARIMESVFIAVGILSLLTMVKLRQDHAGHDALHAFVELHGLTFLLGPGFVVGIGNGLTLGYLIYRSGLMPKSFALLGLIGGPLIIVSGIGVMCGLSTTVQGVATVPEILWEASIGIYLTAKGAATSMKTSSSRRMLVPQG